MSRGRGINGEGRGFTGTNQRGTFPHMSSPLPADGGQHEGRSGGVSARRTGAAGHPVPRRVPVLRQTEGPQQLEPDGATGTHVSAPTQTSGPLLIRPRD